MRIERHEVRAEALTKATADFLDRIGGAVHREQEAGRDLNGWDIIAGDLLDYAGARSVERPDQCWCAGGWGGLGWPRTTVDERRTP